MNNVYLKPMLIILVLGLIIVIGGVLNHYRGEINLSKVFREKTKKDDGFLGYVKYGIVSNAGRNVRLKMELAIPYEDDKQRNDLTIKMSRIKSDFLMEIDQVEMEKWVNKREFSTIKGRLLKIINRHTNKPVEELYFESFNFY